ncbi:hypothetical protein C4G95_RS23660 [Vibrio parahaemolyticus]|nr:hypothetical protein [Vibrio parahaemolyticus]
MDIVLAVATILGGITAIWFFWDKYSISKKPKPERLSNAEKVQKRAGLRPVFEEKLLDIRKGNLSGDVIVHDVSRLNAYPEVADESGISPWFRIGLLETYHRGIRVGLRIGYLTETDSGYRYTDHKNEKGTIKVWLVGEIPFESIESINWDGDEYYHKPHIYCHFEHANGEPYERLVFCEKRELQPGWTYFSEIADYEDVEKRSKAAGIENFA